MVVKMWWDMALAAVASLDRRRKGDGGRKPCTAQSASVSSKFSHNRFHIDRLRN